jgi:hypothetical protein
MIAKLSEEIQSMRTWPNLSALLFIDSVAIAQSAAAQSSGLLQGDNQINPVFFTTLHLISRAVIMLPVARWVAEPLSQ